MYKKSVLLENNPKKECLWINKDSWDVTTKPENVWDNDTAIVSKKAKTRENANEWEAVFIKNK